MKKISLLEILSLLKSHSINVNTSLEDNFLFENINSLKSSNNNDLTFFSNVKYLNDLKETKAKACIINKVHINHLPKKCQPIVVDDPYLVLAYLSDLFNHNKKKSNGIIASDAFIHENCILNKNIQIDSFSYLDDNTEIDSNVIIGANTKIGPNVLIKKNCIINDNVSISNSIIYENCEVKSGARIGGMGFGFAQDSKTKINHHGNVIIKKYSTIGSNTTIDRAVFDSTIIGEFSQIDNLVQIAHNVILGDHSIIAAQVGIAGSTIIGDNITIGGQAGISGHLKIGNNVTIAGKSGVTKNIEDNKIVAGFPAKDIKSWKRDVIKVNKLK